MRMARLFIMTIVILCAATAAAPAQDGTVKRTPGIIQPGTEEKADAAPGQSAMPAAPGSKRDPFAKTPDMQYVFDQLPPDMQNELMDEMEFVNTLCNGTLAYSKYHNCDCIAVKLLDRRLQDGPERSVNNLLPDVSKQCVNKPAIAGYHYKLCHDRLRPYGEKYAVRAEEICTCTANKVAELYAYSPATSLRYQISLVVRAQEECGYGGFIKEFNIDQNLKRKQKENYLP
jgi:hypothetical protein